MDGKTDADERGIIMLIKRRKIEEYEQKILELEDSLKIEKNKKWDAQNELADANGRITSLEAQIASLRSENDNLRKENEMLRKYYKLDEEPSDEIKTKIHIDLEINRLKEERENLKTMYYSALACRPQYYYPMGIGNCYLL